LCMEHSLVVARPGSIRQSSPDTDDASLAVCTTAPSVYLWDLRLIRQQLKAMNLDWEEGRQGTGVR